MKKTKPVKFELSPLPKNEEEAVNWLLPFLDLDRNRMRGVPTPDFKRAWYSVAFLYVGLHPDSALEHGTRISHDSENYEPVSRLEPRLIKPFYEQSGWPVVLVPLAKEAWRRYENGDLEDDEFYCSEAQMAGICYRSPALAKEVYANRHPNQEATA